MWVVDVSLVPTHWFLPTLPAPSMFFVVVAVELRKTQKSWRIDIANGRGLWTRTVIRRVRAVWNARTEADLIRNVINSDRNVAIHWTRYCATRHCMLYVESCDSDDKSTTYRPIDADLLLDVTTL